MADEIDRAHDGGDDDMFSPCMHAWQVAGYVIEYKGVVFATVRGSGHMVPIDSPARGLALFSSFIKGEPLPKAAPMVDG
jgi:carboxypeptidase C (cathepsin A)